MRLFNAVVSVVQVANVSLSPIWLLFLSSVQTLTVWYAQAK